MMLRSDGQRICHVVGDSRFGGGSRIVLDLVQAAAESGYVVSVIGTDPLFVSNLVAAGVRPVTTISICRDIKPLSDLRSLDMLIRYFRRERYDIVHTHTSKAGILGRLAARLANVPVIIHTVHGFAFHEQTRPAAVSLLVTAERIASHWCDRVVTVSHYHREWARALGIVSPDKLIAIPNGIEIPKIHPDYDRDSFRRSLGVESEDILLLAIGRLAEQKGFRYLIEATRLLVDRIATPVRVLIAGDGPLHMDLTKRIADAGLDGTVSLLGFRDDVGDLYQAADIVVQPSLWEGLSISLLEALSRGRPVITTDIGSNREVIGDSGAAMVIPCKDPERMAEAISQLVLNRDQMYMMSEAAYKIYLNGYTRERMQAAYLDLYATLIGKRRERT